MSTQVMPRPTMSEAGGRKFPALRTGSTNLRTAHTPKLFSTWDERKWGGVHAALRQWESLDSAWDGPETVQPYPKALEFFRAFAAVASRTVAEPQPYFASDGEIGLRWASTDLKAILSVRANGRLIGFAQRGSARVSISNVAEWKTKWEDFLKMLGKHA